ncbi:MAG TPA: PRC-barrel domain-containing protein [Bdellovibrionota bacterium]|nr:PRC-barrel domain-containing protein [Bdellovibrionota bacterium]
MLKSLESLTNMVVQATDGEIGSVEEFYFDDEKWTVRYLVVQTGGWLTGKKVLISPIAVEQINVPARAIHVSLTRKQVEDSPSIDTDKPVSRQLEARYYDYYRWPYYWTGAGVWGMAPYPAGMLGRPPTSASYASETAGTETSANQESKGDPHLRSSDVVRGYRIEATDGRFGHVDDFIIEDDSWRIRYLVADTVNFWPSKSVLISPEWVDSISWKDRKCRVNLAENVIKGSPEYLPGETITRDYEERLYSHYGRPKYWSSERSDASGKETAA